MTFISNDQPGASPSGLKAGVNANQLRKMVSGARNSRMPLVKDGMIVTSSAFIPVVAIHDPCRVGFGTRSWPVPEPERSPLSPRAAPAARLSAEAAVDQLSQMDINAIETSLEILERCSLAALTAFNYSDTSGVMHSFTAGNFTDFAAVVRDDVYDSKVGDRGHIAGASIRCCQHSMTAYH